MFDIGFPGECVHENSLGLVDEILIYQAPVLLGGGAVSPFAAPRLDNMDDRVHLEWIETRQIAKDMRLRLKPVFER